MWTETTIEDVIEKATECHRQGKRWHFHMLTPGCMFNTRGDRYAFVLENSADGATYVVYSGQPSKEAGQTLVQMLHGHRILDESQAIAAARNPVFEAALGRAREMTARGAAWHHHMLFPDCLFNPQRGRWNIVVEDTENDQILQSTYDEEPARDLRELEVLFYQKS